MNSVYKMGRVLVIQVNKVAARAAPNSATLRQSVSCHSARPHPSSHSTAWSTILGVRW